jgi:predicted GIY-YIG superfamily endonuclease
MTTNIYILELEHGCYYVGKSENPMKRLQEHLNGSGSAWTRKHKPLKILKVVENVSTFDEDKFTKEYMSKYGIDKVRGGSYVGIELDEFQEECLKREIWGAKDKCTNCGRKGHFVKDCYAKTNINGDSLESDSEEESEGESEEIIICSDCDKEFDSDYLFNRHKCYPKKNPKNSCFRCGREGHYANNCYANTHKKGYFIN